MSKILKFSLVFTLLLSNLFALENGFFLSATLGTHISGVRDDFNSKMNNIVTTQTSNTSQVIQNIRTQFSEGKQFFPAAYFDAGAGGVYKLSTLNLIRVDTSFGFTRFFIRDRDSKNFYKLNFGGDYLLALDDTPNASGLVFGGGFSIGYGEFTKYLGEIKSLKKEVKLNLPYLNFGGYKGFGVGKQYINYGVKVPIGDYYFTRQDKEVVVDSTNTKHGEKSLTTSVIFYVSYAYNFEFPKTVY